MHISVWLLQNITTANEKETKNQQMPLATLAPKESHALSWRKLPKNVKEDCAARKSQIMTKDLWLTSKPLPIDTPKLRIYKMTSKNDTFSIRMGFLHLHWKPIFLRRVNNFFRKRPVWNGSVYFDVFTLLATENKTLLYFHPHRRHKCGQKS